MSSSNKLDNRGNTDTKEPQFIKLKSQYEEQIEKSFNYYINLTKNTNNNREKTEKIQKCIKNDNNKYIIIMEALLYGILYDSSNSEIYFKYLLEINKDNFDYFLEALKTLIDLSHMDLPHSIFMQIYILFDKVIHSNNSKLCEILNLLCRCIYPNSQLLYVDNTTNSNDYLDFLRFLDKKVQFIVDISNIVNGINIVGCVFIKILRLLTETHFYITKKNGENYKKLNISPEESKIYEEIYQLQIGIITKFFNQARDKVYKIGKELIRIIIQLARADIDIINQILEDISKNNKYNEILNVQYYTGYNLYALMQIPPLMEKMIIYILTKVIKSSGNYVIYFKWILKKFSIEHSIGQTIIVDIARYIITCSYFYKQNPTEKDPTPRWLILCYILKTLKNNLLSSEVKQSIFFDWITFKRQKDQIDVIEPGILAIFVNAKDYPDISLELIEFLDYYCDCFDRENSKNIRDCVYEAMKLCQDKGVIKNLNDLTYQIHSRPDIMKKYKNLIKYNEQQTNFEILIDTPQIPNSNNNVGDKKIFIKNINYIGNNNRNDNSFDSQKLLSPDSKNKSFDEEINTNIKFSPPYNKEEVSNIEINLKSEQENKLNIFNNENKVDVNEEYTISQDFYNLIPSTTLNNFIHMKSTNTFKALLLDLCKKVFKQLKEKNSSYESKLTALEPKITSCHINFAKFFLNNFKDEILLYFDNYTINNNKLYISQILFEVAFNSFNEINCNFYCDLIRKILEIYPPFIVSLIMYLLTNIHSQISENIPEKELYDILYKFYVKIFNFNLDLAKEKLIIFFNTCVEKFNLEIINFFVENNGLRIFNTLFKDESEIIINITSYASFQSINVINLDLIYDRYILFDKNIYNIIKVSLELTQAEQNKLWSMILSQRKIPSANIKDYIENFIQFSNELYNKNTPKIIFDCFFNHFSISLRNLFSQYITMNKSIGGNLLYCLFNFNPIFKDYIYHIFVLIFTDFPIYKSESFHLIIKDYIDTYFKEANQMNNFKEFVMHFMKMETLSSNKKVDYHFFDISGKYSIDEMKNTLKKI